MAVGIVVYNLNFPIKGLEGLSLTLFSANIQEKKKLFLPILILMLSKAEKREYFWTTKLYSFFILFSLGPESYFGAITSNSL